MSIVRAIRAVDAASKGQAAYSLDMTLSTGETYEVRPVKILGDYLECLNHQDETLYISYSHIVMFTVNWL